MLRGVRDAVIYFSFKKVLENVRKIWHRDGRVSNPKDRA